MVKASSPPSSEQPKADTSASTAAILLKQHSVSCGLGPPMMRDGGPGSIAGSKSDQDADEQY
jgi:hypothetical protein